MEINDNIQNNYHSKELFIKQFNYSKLNKMLREDMHQSGWPCLCEGILLQINCWSQINSMPIQVPILSDKSLDDLNSIILEHFRSNQLMLFVSCTKPMLTGPKLKNCSRSNPEWDKQSEFTIYLYSQQQYLVVPWNFTPPLRRTSTRPYNFTEIGNPTMVTLQHLQSPA